MTPCGLILFRYNLIVKDRLVDYGLEGNAEICRFRKLSNPRRWRYLNCNRLFEKSSAFKIFFGKDFFLAAIMWLMYFIEIE